MPIDAEELDGRFVELREEIGLRLTPLEDAAHYTNARTATVVDDVEALRAEFAVLINDFNTLIDKLQSCSRAQDLVDEQCGSLDEFLESFRRY